MKGKWRSFLWGIVGIFLGDLLYYYVIKSASASEQYIIYGILLLAIILALIFGRSKKK